MYPISKQQSIFEKSIKIGFAGITAVSIQTLILYGATNIINQYEITKEKLFNLLKKIQKQQGFMSLYRGAFRSFLFAGISRFGDNAINFTLLESFNNNKNLYKTPLWLQSALVWSVACIWRILITPLSLICCEVQQNRIKINKIRTQLPNFLSKIRNLYSTRVQSDLIPLYTWFLTQNYLIEKTTSIRYSTNFLSALIRYSIIGFCSMISFDACLTIFRLVMPDLYIKSSKNTLLGQCQARPFMKGLHGIIFCTVSQLVKQLLQ